MSEVLFKETQKFRQKILWIFLTIVCGSTIFLFGYAFINQIVLGNKLADNPTDDWVVILAFIFAFVFSGTLFSIFYFLRLETEINDKEIRYRFWPLIRKQKSLPLKHVRNIEFEKYQPIKEFGGWGYRFSLRNKGIALNTSGNKGIRIEMNDGFKILLGTQKPDELERVLNRIKTKIGK